MSGGDVRDELEGEVGESQEGAVEQEYVSIPLERYAAAVALLRRLEAEAEDVVQEYERTREHPPIALAIRFRALIRRALQQLDQGA